jgi:lipopolysaccharide transport system permease protein
MSSKPIGIDSKLGFGSAGLSKFALLPILIRRGIQQRYRGSVLGVLWAFLTPLFMLLVFTFVFGVIFQSRWSTDVNNTFEFAMVLFAGITTYSLFSEIVGAAPGLIIGQPNLVKKVVFPLEILPLVSLGEALFQAAIAFGILLAINAFLGTGFHLTALALPLLIIPLCLTALGLSWFLAALGVYMRDIGQILPTILTALMFMSAVFYPVSALPAWLQPALAFNPIIIAVEMVRNALVFGTLPDLQTAVNATIIGLIIATLGYLFFKKTKGGFADVL